MAAAAAETAAARAEGARVALETELGTVKQREKEKVRVDVAVANRLASGLCMRQF